MATPPTPRLLTTFICHSCRQRLLPTSSRRPITTTPGLRAGPLGGLAAVSNNMKRSPTRTRAPGALSPSQQALAAIDSTDASLLNEQYGSPVDAALREKPHKMHVFATKHNTHITLVQAPRPASKTVSSGISGTSASAADQKKMVDVLLSLSAGNIAFKKAARGSYDAAYQLAAFVLKQMQEKGMLRDMTKLEVVLRGFGAGREAVTKALLGTEGRFVRGKITSVVDATRLKHGGARGKKPRRLG